MNEPRLTREFGNDTAASGPDNPWAVICDGATLASSTRCLAIWLAFDGAEPHHRARLLAWDTFSLLKQERPIEFDSITLDVWAGQRCVEGADLPQIVVGFVGLTAELEDWLRSRMQQDDSFAGDSDSADPIELGLFPVARIASGGVKPRSMPIAFLMACGQRYRLVHSLMPWSRDPYTQVATGAPFPVEFAWMTQDGSIIDAEGGAIEIVSNAKVMAADVPDPESPGATIAQFAATFDGFEEYGDYEAALDTARDVYSRHQQGVDLASDMTLRELRTALFIEHLPSARPGSAEPGYSTVLVRAIRTVVERERVRFQRLRRPSEAPKLGAERDPSASGTALPRTAGTPFEDLDPEEQCLLAHEILLRAGPLEKDDAVRTLGTELRDAGHVAYQRLHSDGPLYALLQEVIERCVKEEGTIDRPRRGWVRAILSDANEYSRDRWRLCLLSAVKSEPVDRDQAVRAAAEWAREQMGLAFERLREGGAIDKGLRSAMNSAIRRGELIRVGSQSIQKAKGEYIENQKGGLDVQKVMTAGPKVEEKPKATQIPVSHYEPDRLVFVRDVPNPNPRGDGYYETLQDVLDEQPSTMSELREIVERDFEIDSDGDFMKFVTSMRDPAEGIIWLDVDLTEKNKAELRKHNSITANTTDDRAARLQSVVQARRAALKGIAVISEDGFSTIRVQDFFSLTKLLDLLFKKERLQDVARSLGLDVPRWSTKEAVLDQLARSKQLGALQRDRLVAILPRLSSEELRALVGLASTLAGTHVSDLDLSVPEDLNESYFGDRVSKWNVSYAAVPAQLDALGERILELATELVQRAYGESADKRYLVLREIIESAAWRTSFRLVRWRE